jgi:hypothetical protein
MAEWNESLFDDDAEVERASGLQFEGRVGDVEER